MNHTLKLYPLLLICLLSTASHQALSNDQPHLQNLTDSPHLILLPCSSEQGEQPYCLEQESSLPLYTFVVCSASQAFCSPVFFSTQNTPLAFPITSDTLGRGSPLFKDLAYYKDHLHQKKKFPLIATSSLVGGSFISLLMHYGARQGVNFSSNPSAFMVMAVSLAGTAVGYYIFDSWLKPSFLGEFLGQASGIIPNHPGPGLPYYEFTPAQLSLITQAPGLFQGQALDLKEDSTEIILALAQGLKHYGVAGETSLAKVCHPEPKNALKCYSATTHELTTPPNWKQKISNQTSQNPSPPQEVKTPTPAPSPTEVALFAGVPYQELTTPALWQACPKAESLSPHSEDLQLYVVEGYFNCLFHLGGEACKAKYACALKPKDTSSCLALSKALSQAKEDLGYPAAIPTSSVQRFCQSY